jgi:hypothetical protein
MILVDPIRTYTRARHWNKEWCHMVSDTSLDELHAMAEAIGLPGLAFEGDHYDLTPARRQMAVERGAVEVSSKELVRRMVPSRLRPR